VDFAQKAIAMKSDLPTMNKGYSYTETLSVRGVGSAVLTYMAGRYTHSTTEQWTAHILAGRVTVNGRGTSAQTVLQLGDVLVFHREPWQEPDAPLSAPVLYDHDGVVVVHKPPGLPTMSGGGFLEHTLVHQLRLLHGDVAPLHRLGRWTSGAVLCARGREMGAALSKQFQQRTIGKRYRALASGCPDWVQQTITTPIGPVPYAPLGTVHASSPTGRNAHTAVSVIQQDSQSFIADVEFATGRPHQIRIHLASIGHPLVADPLYGPDGLPKSGGTAVPGDPGYSLHSAEIRFVHPSLSQPVVVQAVPPADLKLRS
jgi:23S rRNA pseudouridine1911/1915/1917 synthase